MGKSVLQWVLAPAAAAVLVACGGGGGGSPVATATSIGGTVAVGAPLRSANIEIYDVSGTVVAETSTDAEGKYQVQIPAGAQGPFVIKAVYADEALYSIYTGQGTVANVSHLTDAVVAMLSPNGAADGLLINKNSAANVTASNVSQAVEKMLAAVSPAVSAIDDLPADANFLSTAFDANGTGLDRLLDAAAINVTAKTINNQKATNIGIVFNTKQQLNELNANKFVAFVSSQSANSIRESVSRLEISPDQLPPANIGQLYNEFIDRLNACYAVPFSERFSGDSIVSQACKDIFYNSDPASYKDGGFNVRERFTSIFTARNQIRFTPTLSPIIAQDLVGTQASGKALIASKGQDSLGNYSYNRFYVKKFSLNGRDVLGVIGDQNDYEFYVNSENEHRTFPMSSLDLDYVQSQFALILRLPNAARINATAAVVEGPGGRFLMAPLTGRDNFRLCRKLRDDEITPDSVIQRPNCDNKPPLLVYSSRFINPNVARRSTSASNVESPLDFDFINNDFFVVKKSDGSLFTESEISGIPNGAVWKASVYFSDGAKKELFTHNVSRPMTAAELMGADSPIERAAKFTQLEMSEGPSKPARVVDFSSSTPLRPNAGIPPWSQNSTDPYRRGQDNYTPAWAPVQGGFKFKWNVDPAQIAPFIVFVSGQVRIDWEGNFLPLTNNNITIKPVQAMEDQVRFPVSRRETTVFCTPTPYVTTPNDESCDLDLDTSQYTLDSSDKNIYNPGTRMTSTSLISRDQQQRSIIRGYFWFIPTAGGSTSFVQASQ